MPNNVTTAIAAAESQLGVPYVFGGESPKGSAHPGFDCSGLMQWSYAQAGASIPRTTQTQWLVLPRVNTPSPGDLILFNVPADGPPQPQHVGMYLGPNRMIEAPHTGTVVKYSTIPNIQSERIMGYCHVAFPGPPPPPPPPPPVIKETQMYCTDPSSGTVMCTDKNGALYANIPSLTVGNLVQHPTYHAGTSESGGTNPCIGITPWMFNGQWGYCYITQPTSGTGGFGPYDLYHFDRSGNPH